MLEFWKDLVRECGILDKKVRLLQLDIFGYLQSLKYNFIQSPCWFTLVLSNLVPRALSPLPARPSPLSVLLTNNLSSLS